MTGPQQSRPSPVPRAADNEPSRPSPRSRHGMDEPEAAFPENSYQGGGYPDLRTSHPVERPAPWTRGDYPDPPLYGTPERAAGGDGGGSDVPPGGYAAPTRYDGRGIPVQAGTAQHDAPQYGTSPYETPQHDAPREDGTQRHHVPRYDPAQDDHLFPAARDDDHTDTPVRPAAVPYADPPRYAATAARGGTAVDGGPTYDVARREGPGGGGAVPLERSGNGGPDTAVAAPEVGVDPDGSGGSVGRGGTDSTDHTDSTAAATAIPAQRGPAERGPRPMTVAEAAAARGFSGRDDRGPAGPAGQAGPGGTGSGPADRGTGGYDRPGNRSAEVRVAKDSGALTVLRWITYLLVCLCCLIFLAAVVRVGIGYLEFRSALEGSPFLGGFPGLGG